MRENLRQEALSIIARIVNEKKYACKHCGAVCTWKNKHKFQLICSWKPCRKRCTAFHGTIFEASKLGLEKVLEIIYLWCNGASRHLISSIVGINKSTASLLLKKLAVTLVPHYYSRLPLLGGAGCIVEIDESKLGKRKYNRGHRVEGVWVFGMVERSPTRRILMFRVAYRDKSTLTDIMRTNVDGSSIIYSDSWRGYVDLKHYFAQHLTVNHSRYFKDPLTGVCTNTIEGEWGALKADTPKRKRTQQHIDLYLVRYMLKRNEPGELFINLIKYLF